MTLKESAEIIVVSFVARRLWAVHRPSVPLIRYTSHSSSIRWRGGRLTPFS